MSGYERSIRVAFDEKSGEVIEAEQVFDTAKNGFITRRQFHRDEIELYCCECMQKLNVSTSKFDRLHFKHEPYHQPCKLTDSSLSPREIDEINRVFLAKESLRHIELKNKIGTRLAIIEGIEPGTIAIDNKVITLGMEKRRPDVYCIYKGKQIVFEIQLSNLSLKYLLGRHEFYRNNGIYLVWILDNFDVHDQSQMTRDIKYLTPYENFFRLDETVEHFQLNSQYKLPFLGQNNQVMTKWMNKPVKLSELSFDERSCDVYFFDFVTSKAQTEQEQQRIAAQRQAVEQKELETRRMNAAKTKAKEIIDTIKDIKKREGMVYDWVKENISEFDEFEVEVLNAELKLNIRIPGKKPALNRWLAEAKKHDSSFLSFILGCNEIRLEVNDTDDSGLTSLQELYSNELLISKYHFAKALFRRGYILTHEDEKFLVDLLGQKNADQLVVFVACSKLKDRELVDTVYNHQALLCIIESSKRQSITGFRYKPHEWAAFGNNAIEHYKNYWEYIEIAFKKYGIWNKIINADRKGTFQKKLQQLQLPPQAFDFDPVFLELYPEIIA